MKNAAGSRNIAAVCIFLLFFCTELGLGIYLSHYRDFVYYDAVSRVANAFYVLHSRDPHLGAIGFVWNPLPSLLEIIPLLFWRWIPPLAGAGLAANLLTALFAAGTAVMIFNYCRASIGSPFIATAITFAYACNPFIFLYGANGMSEAMFCFFIVWMIIQFTKWMNRDAPLAPIIMGFALALAFWVRYESIALGMALAFAITAVFLDRRRDSAYILNRARRKNDITSKLEAILTVVLSPAVFSGIAWLLLNYFIMGDALFFFRSGYSNIAFSGNLTDQFREMISTPAGVLWLVLRKSLFFSLPLLAIILVRFIIGYWKRWDTLALVLLAASIPAMQYAMLLKGSSFGWLRFFVYPFVIAVAWMPYELSRLRQSMEVKRVAAVFCLSILLSGFVVLDMKNQELSPDEYETFHIDESGTHKDLVMAKAVSRYINDIIAAEPVHDRPLILTDSYSAYSVLLNTRYPERWVITNDRDFEPALLAPREHGVEYILVSKKIGSVLQIIHETYPDLFDKGAPWATLVRDFDGEWKLFRVTASAPSR
ncbi:MAG: hypothetical protein K0R57_3882 [Paenibacillaceae bacterium]|jgi:hypothetical protein|nr:hypothetical protein [Paenibacillaceae bacterium]